jgi:hypothetical protein
LTLLAAGKNEVAHLQFHPRVHWLMNAGRGFPSDQGEWLVSPYLRRQGINHLAGILLTDFYSKHTGGLPNLLRNFSLDYFVYPSSVKKARFIPSKAIADKRVNHVSVQSGEKIRIRNGEEIAILGMVKDQMIVGASYKEQNFLFLPALNPEILEVLKRCRDFLMQVHGMILPSFSPQQFVHSRELLEGLFELVDPDFVIAPNSEVSVEEILKDRDIPLFDLARHGAVTIAIEERRPALFPFIKASEKSTRIHSFLTGELAI